MFATCSCSFLNFLFPVSFLLNSQCWCQNHVQHLPLYFSLFKKTLQPKTPSYLHPKAPFHISSNLHPFPSPSLSLASKVHPMSPNTLISLFLSVYFISLNVPILPFMTRVLKFVFSRKFLRCNLNECIQCANGRMIPREVRGLVKVAQSNPNACYGTHIGVQRGFVKGLHGSFSV